MASHAVTPNPAIRKRRTNDPTIHPGVNASYYHYNSRSERDHRTRGLWRSLLEMDWRKCYTKWSNRRFWYNLHRPHSWRSVYSRNSDQISRSRRNNRHRSNYRNYFYYYLLIGLLSINPVRAEDEINNTSNPVAAATGNVTNQAVQFQNNGAASSQNYGPNISCNGPSMT